MYLDLCYIPNHSNSKNVDVEFFKRVRSSYYVVSGNDPAAEEPSRAVLDALLEGKAQWGSNMQVRVPGRCLYNTWSCVQRQREGIMFNETTVDPHEVPRGPAALGQSGFHTQKLV